MSDVEEQRPSAEDSAVEPPPPSAAPEPAQAEPVPSGPRLLRPLETGRISLGGGGDGPVAETAAEIHARLCEVELSEFEGPLDLLLHLVRRHELDILDIPISFVCEKYLEYIEFMRTLELEVAGDYLVMAATLAYLKSRELVPRQEEEVEAGIEEEGPDPRAQLIERLLEYQKFRDAARKLDERPMAGRDTFARGQAVELPPVDAGLAPITLFRLAEAYQRVLERARIHKSHEVVMETISVAARMQQLTSILLTRSPLDFEKLFLEKTWSSEDELRSMLVVTLMSVLELVRMGIASVYQAAGAESIVIERVASEAEAKVALAEYDEAVSYGKASSAKAPEPEESADEESLVDDAEALGLLDDDYRDEDQDDASEQVADPSADSALLDGEAEPATTDDDEAAGLRLLDDEAERVAVDDDAAESTLLDADGEAEVASTDDDEAVESTSIDGEADVASTDDDEAAESTLLDGEADVASTDDDEATEFTLLDAEADVAVPDDDEAVESTDGASDEDDDSASRSEGLGASAVDLDSAFTDQRESDEDDDGSRDPALDATLSDEQAAAEHEAAAEPQGSIDPLSAAERPSMPEGPGSPDEQASSAPDAGVFVRSVVSDSPPFDAVSRGDDDAPPLNSNEDDDALGSREGDGEEHRENGEAQEVEGS